MKKLLKYLGVGILLMFLLILGNMANVLVCVMGIPLFLIPLGCVLRKRT